MRHAPPPRHWARLQVSVLGALFDWSLAPLELKLPEGRSGDCACSLSAFLGPRPGHSVNTELKCWLEGCLRAWMWGRGMHISGSQNGLRQWSSSSCSPEVSCVISPTPFLPPCFLASSISTLVYRFQTSPPCRWEPFLLWLKKIYIIGVWLLYSVVWASNVQQSESVNCVCVCSLSRSLLCHSVGCMYTYIHALFSFSPSPPPLWLSNAPSLFCLVGFSIMWLQQRIQNQKSGFSN